MIATGLGGRIAVIDTEHNSADLYADLYDFDSMSLTPPYTPERFIEAINDARDAGYSSLIIDSVTHEWNGSGGCLELNEAIAKAKFKGNTWSAWSETTPRHRRFLDAILSAPMHVIATMRSKTETAQTDNGGRKTITKLGMKSEQKEGVEYEFTTVLDIVHEGHFALASKDRTGLFTDKDPKAITPDTGKILLAWLESGAEPQPEAAAHLDTTSGVTDFDVNDYVFKIESAESLKELQSVFYEAYKLAKDCIDKVAAQKFTTAKDARKTELLNDQHEVQQDEVNGQ